MQTKGPAQHAERGLFLSAAFHRRVRLDAKLSAIGFYGWQVLLELWIISQELQNLSQGHDADHRNTEVTLHFLDRRQLAVTALLAVQGNQHASSLGALGLDD